MPWPIYTELEQKVIDGQDNRTKNAARLKFLKGKGMQVEEHPDIAAFRAKVANLKNMDIYSAPEVHKMLIKILNAVK